MEIVVSLIRQLLTPLESIRQTLSGEFPSRSSGLATTSPALAMSQTVSRKFDLFLPSGVRKQ